MYAGLLWRRGNRRKRYRCLERLQGVIPVRLHGKRETASKVAGSGMALRGGRLRSCFSFSTPPRQRSKDLRTFLRFPLTSYLWSTCFHGYTKGVFRDQQNIKKPLLSPSKGMTDSGFRLAFYNSPSINLIRYTSGFSRSSGKLHKSTYSLCSIS